MSRIKIGNIKGPKGDKGEQGAVGPKGEQGIQGPVGPAGGVDSVNGMTGDVTVEDTQGVNLLTGTNNGANKWSKNTKDGSHTIKSENIDGVNAVRFETTIASSGYDVCLFELSKNELNKLSPNEKYTLSFDVKANMALDLLNIRICNMESSVIICDNVSTSSAVGDEIFHNIRIVLTANNIFNTSNQYIYIDGLNKVGYAVVKNLKLERGTVTDPVWTPAPEDLVMKGEVDGRNLILNSDINVENDEYMIVEVHSEEPIRNGMTYTVTIWGSINENDGFAVFFGNRSVDGTKSFGKANSEMHSIVYTAPISFTNATDDKTIVRIYNRVTNRQTAVIKRIKIEIGENPNPHWTPAPEDVVVRSELDALIKRIVALEAEAGITSADSMELPSADVMESDLETASADETTDDTEIN